MLFFQKYKSRRRDIIVVMSNLRENDRERFILQKRTILANELKYVNLIVQFNKIKHRKHADCTQEYRKNQEI